MRMRTTSLLRVLATCTASVAMWASGPVMGASIGVNFSEERDGAVRVEQSLAPADVAGHPAVAQANWNNYIITDTPAAAPTDDSGVPQAGVTVSWQASNAWGDGSADTSTADGRLARGNFDDGSTDGGTGTNGADILVTGIPYAEYSVVLYLSSDQGSSGTFGSSTSDPLREYRVNDQSAAGGTTNSFSDFGGWVPGENLLAFTGLSGDLNIIAPSRAGSIRGSIAGFQIIEGSVVVPEPGGVLLLGIGLVSGLAMRRRSRR